MVYVVIAISSFLATDAHMAPEEDILEITVQKNATSAKNIKLIGTKTYIL